MTAFLWFLATVAVVLVLFLLDEWMHDDEDDWWF